MINTKKEDKQIQIFINGKEVSYIEATDELKDMEYIYKEEGKWYIHKYIPKTVEKKPVYRQALTEEDVGKDADSQ